MHTVPLRSRGAGQRANLIEIPSGVLRTPTTAPSGTGLAGMETSFIERYFRNSTASRLAAGKREAGTFTRRRLAQPPAALTTNMREPREIVRRSGAAQCAVAERKAGRFRRRPERVVRK